MTRADKDKYAKDLEQAEAKLERLEAEREELEERITEAKSAVVHLSALSGVDVAKEIVANVGLSATCELALKMAGSPMTVPRIKRLVADLGYDIDRHKNPLASIHSTIRRLQEREKVRSVVKDGNTAYEWVRDFKKKKK